MNYSPLRYPGGKTSLYDFLRKTLEVNNIVDGEYAEAFAGGAGAALKLLMLENVYKIHLNDKDEMIYKFWKAILFHTDELVELIESCKIDINEWKYRHEILQNKNLREELTDVEIGFTTFFLNRSNRSGILKAGAIGGNNQQGNWKLDARFNKEDLISKIKKIALYRDRIELYNMNAVDFLRQLNRRNPDSNEILFYLDPPYVEQGEGLYNLFYKADDHLHLSSFLQKKLKSRWIVSYDDHPLIHQIYKEVNKNIFEFNYFANKTKVGNELIICSKNCASPDNYLHYSKSKQIQNQQKEFIAI